MIDILQNIGFMIAFMLLVAVALPFIVYICVHVGTRAYLFAKNQFNKEIKNKNGEDT